MLTAAQMKRFHTMMAVVIVVLILIIAYCVYGRQKEGLFSRQVSDNPSNPQNYEYGRYLACRRGNQEGMMNTFHWDQDGTFGHTGPTWGIPPKSAHAGPDYSGYSKNAMTAKDNMSVGAQWSQEGTYGRTADTLPDFGLSGYYEEVPTPSYV